MSDIDVHVSDCTLRDFRNAPGVYFSDDEASDIARLLASVGVDEIEAGIVSGRSRADLPFIAHIAALDLAPATAALFFASRAADIDGAVESALDAGCSVLTVTVGVSPKFLERKLGRSFRAACHLMSRAVERAASRGLSVVCGGEDSGHADLDTLATFVRIAGESGASRFRFAESVSCLTPTQVARVFEPLCAGASIPVEAHCHSAFGLGTANAITALESGARGVSGTVEGFGERGGNTSTTAALIYLREFRAESGRDLTDLKRLSETVSRAAHLPLHRFNAITGDSAFEYEIGKQFTNADMYDAFDPALVGNRRHLALGLKGDPGGLRTLVGDEPSALRRARERAREHVIRHRTSYRPAVSPALATA